MEAVTLGPGGALEAPLGLYNNNNNNNNNNKKPKTLPVLMFTKPSTLFTIPSTVRWDRERGKRD